MASAINNGKQLSVFRAIVKELNRGKLVGTPSYKYMLDKYKSNQVTAARHCREQYAAAHDASTYYCLLRSTREYDELVTKYHGDGEDTTQKAANRVGLQLPRLYQEETDVNTEPNNDQPL